MSENLNTKKRNLKRNALTGEQKKKYISLVRQLNSNKNNILNYIMSKKVLTQLEQCFDFNLNN